MTTEVISVDPDTSVQALAALLWERGIKRGDRGRPRVLLYVNKSSISCPAAQFFETIH
jgi:hypothetical protein